MKWHIYNKHISLENIEHSNNGGMTNLNITNKRSLQFNYDTTGLKEGYYTSFLGFVTTRSYTSKDVVSFQIATNTSVNMNLDLILSKSDHAKLKEQTVVLCQRDESEIYDVLTVKNGTVTIPANFKGKVMLPLQGLESVKQTSFQSLGIIVVAPEDQITSFTLTNLNLSEDEGTLFQQVSEVIRLDPMTAEIPTIGEYTYEVRIESEKIAQLVESVRFELIEDREGVTVSKDGTLTITPEAKEGNITIQAIYDDKFRVTSEIHMVHPWYVKGNDVNFYVPRNWKEINANVQTRQLALSTQKTIRNVIGVSALLYLIFYVTVIRSKKSKRKRG